MSHYQLCSVMSTERRVDVNVVVKIRPPPISPPGSVAMVKVYVDRNPLVDHQTNSGAASTRSLPVSIEAQ